MWKTGELIYIYILVLSASPCNEVPNVESPKTRVCCFRGKKNVNFNMYTLEECTAWHISHTYTHGPRLKGTVKGSWEPGALHVPFALKAERLWGSTAKRAISFTINKIWMRDELWLYFYKYLEGRRRVKMENISEALTFRDRALTADLWLQPAFEGPNAFLITGAWKQGLNLPFQSLVISFVRSWADNGGEMWLLHIKWGVSLFVSCCDHEHGSGARTGFP